MSPCANFSGRPVGSIFSSSAAARRESQHKAASIAAAKAQSLGNMAMLLGLSKERNYDASRHAVGHTAPGDAEQWGVVDLRFTTPFAEAQGVPPGLRRLRRFAVNGGRRRAAVGGGALAAGVANRFADP